MNVTMVKTTRLLSALKKREEECVGVTSTGTYEMSENSFSIGNHRTSVLLPADPVSSAVAAIDSQ